MIRDDKLRKYLEKFGKRGEMTLSVLGKDIDFIEALNSEIGHELLKDLAERHERLLNVISEIKATDEEKITVGCRYCLYYSVIVFFRNSFLEKVGEYFISVTAKGMARSKIIFPQLIAV